MHIECVDSLKVWLLRELRPISGDAEPDALAKYIMALLKKPDRTEDEVKSFSMEQLEVFLKESTKRFVEKMFAALKDNSYIPKRDVSPVHETKTARSKSPNPSSSLGTQDRDESKPSASTSRDPRSDRERRPVNTSSGGAQRDVKRDDKERAVRKRISPPPVEQKRDREVRERENREPARRRSRSPRDRRVRQRRSPERNERRHPVTKRSSRSRSGERERRERKPEETRKKRCRDFDEKGLCMRGDSCQYDHGPDPVVVDHENAMDKIAHLPVKNGPNFSIPPPGYNPMNPPPPGVDSSFGAHSIGGIEGYNPEAPSLSASNFSVPPPPLPVHMNTAPWRSTAYSVPTANMVMPASYDPTSTIPVDPSSAPSVPPMRGGGSMRGRGRGAVIGSNGRFPLQNRTDNRTIQVKKIPHEQNNITKLNEHFAAFGNIVNLQVQYNGDPECAIITYSNRHEAAAALRSPSAVLNNRFIKVFWHNSDSPEASSSNQNVSTTYSAAGSHQRSVLQSGVHVDVPVPTPPVINEPIPPTKVATVQEAKFVSQTIKDERIKSAATKSKLKDVLERRARLLNVQKQSSNLMDGLIKQQKTVLGMMKTKKDPASRQRLKAISTDLSEKIDTCKVNLSESLGDLKEIAAEVSELEKQLERAPPRVDGDAERSSESPSLSPPPEGEEGMVAVVATHNLLKRSAGDAGLGDGDDIAEVKRTQDWMVQVKGFDLADEQALLSAMEEFGDLRDFEILPGDGSTNAAAVVTFNKRGDAERALSIGVELKGTRLDMSWSSVPIRIETSQRDTNMTANQLLNSMDNESDEE